MHALDCTILVIVIVIVVIVVIIVRYKQAQQQTLCYAVLYVQSNTTDLHSRSSNVEFFSRKKHVTGLIRLEYTLITH